MKPHSATPSRLKYLKCECCSFLAVIPRHDRHEGLLCPFCTKVQCAHGGKFFEVTRDTFENEADLDTPRSERVMPSLQEQADDELRMRLDHPLSLTRAVDALRGMYGLLQLFASRSEIAQHLGDWESNHRAEEARLVMALAEQHGSASRSATAGFTATQAQQQTEDFWKRQAADPYVMYAHFDGETHEVRGDLSGDKPQGTEPFCRVCGSRENEACPYHTLKSGCPHGVPMVSAKGNEPLEHALRMLDNAKMRVGSFGNMNIDVVRRDEAAAIMRDALRQAVIESLASRSSVVANEGETPRTDEWERNCEFKSVGPGRVDFADPYHALLKFARQLERELAAARGAELRWEQMFLEEVEARRSATAESDKVRLDWLFSRLNDTDIKAKIDLVAHAYCMGGLTGIRRDAFRDAIDQAMKRGEYVDHERKTT